MAHSRVIIMPALLSGAMLIAVIGSGYVMKAGPSLEDSILNADALSVRSGERTSVVRIDLIGEKASRCKSNSGFGSMRKISCAKTGASMHKRGNIIFARPPK
ncbi:MAG: hypothetical protein QNI90_05305 [Dinoroseobacter sp.]|nr:hypothetical protein [Dinoroseobacter sp.]